jgi:hypothetical protein
MVPAGSFLVVSHAGADLLPDDVAAFEKSLNAHLPAERHHVARSRDMVTGFFDGIQLLGRDWSGSATGARIPPRTPQPRPSSGAASAESHEMARATVRSGD